MAAASAAAQYAEPGGGLPRPFQARPPPLPLRLPGMATVGAEAVWLVVGAGGLGTVENEVGCWITTAPPVGAVAEEVAALSREVAATGGGKDRSPASDC